mgnify:CR=1 FL=1
MSFADKKVVELAARRFHHSAGAGCSVQQQQPTAAGAWSRSRSAALDKPLQRTQVLSVVSSLLRVRVWFLLLTVLATVSGWQSAAHAQSHVAACMSASDAHGCAGPADGLKQVMSSAPGARQSQLKSPPLPEPLSPAAPDMTDVFGAEDPPEDEELADLPANLLVRLHGVLQSGPASIQLEPAYPPTTELDRPPRA